ncbi:DUF11 domain-containing protein [Streptomyces bambusae]|uniref:DUF11 domain-containing protein n=1 Tax=Streptomyces bambusae TaxID=1550616 RepID=UPI001CFC8EB1|nr:DUF11 domain-containing protein [Streptomyces bambusae]MCB5164645.1 DUF11 domain-containing protein [Streptomyces bambusae]
MSLVTLERASAGTDDPNELLPQTTGLANGGFEADTWGGLEWSTTTPQGWKVSSVPGGPASPKMYLYKAGHSFGVMPTEGGTSVRIGGRGVVIDQVVETVPNVETRWSVTNFSPVREEPFISPKVIISDADDPAKGRQEFTFHSYSPWTTSTGVYKVPNDQKKTRIQIVSDSASGRDLGLDDIRFEYSPQFAGQVDVGEPLHIGVGKTVRTQFRHTGGAAMDGASFHVPVPAGVVIDEDTVTLKKIVDGKDTPVDIGDGRVQFSQNRLLVPLGTGAATGKGGRVDPGDDYVLEYQLKLDEPHRVPATLEFDHNPVIKYNWVGAREVALPQSKVKVAAADLALVKGTFSSEVYVDDQEAKFSVEVENKGEHSAPGTTLKLLKPVNLADFSTADATCKDSTVKGWIECDLGEMAGKTSRTLTFSGKVKADSGTSLFTDVEITSPHAVDGDVNDNSSRYTSRITDDVDVSVNATVLTPDLEPVEQIKPGDKVVLSVKAGNAGPANPGQVKVDVRVPQGAVLDERNADADFKDGVWTIPSLPAGAEDATLLLAATVPADNETIEVRASTKSERLQDVDLSNNDSSKEVAVQRHAALKLGVSADRPEGTYLPGERVVYTIRVDNAGPSTAEDVKVRHVMPEGMEMGKWTGPAGTSYHEGEWSIPRVAVDAEKPVTLTVEGMVPADREKTVHQVCITGSGLPDEQGEFKECGDEEAADAHAASHELAVTQQAEVTVALTADKPKALPGEKITWTVEAVNDGPSTAKGVEIEALLPEGVTDVSVEKEGGDFDEEKGHWKPDGIAPHGKAVLKLTGTVPADRAMVATAQIKGSATQLKDQEAALKAQAKHTLSVRQQADLDVQLTPGADSVAPGEKGTVTVKVSNAGPSTATGTTVELGLPAALKDFANDAGGDFDPATGTWKAGDLKSGEEKSLTLDFTADKAKEYRFDALALTSEAADPNECVDICGSATVTADTAGGAADEAAAAAADEAAGAAAAEKGAEEEKSLVDQALAATGSHALWWGLGALGAAGIGAALLVVARRRSS